MAVLDKTILAGLTKLVKLGLDEKDKQHFETAILLLKRNQLPGGGTAYDAVSSGLSSLLNSITNDTYQVASNWVDDDLKKAKAEIKGYLGLK
jgi:hypothetical protein